MSKYKLLTGVTHKIEELNEEIARHLGQGWVVAGPPVAVAVPNTMSAALIQPMQKV